MSTPGAFRTCPHCSTRNRHYMLVCTRCGRSLQDVALVGTPPPGSVVPRSSRGRRRLAVGVFALLAGLTVAVILSRVLRSAPLGEEAAASSRPGGEAPSPGQASDPGGWETLEQRFAELRPAPTPSSVPAVPAGLPAEATPRPAAEPPPVETAAPVRPRPTPPADPPSEPAAEPGSGDVPPSLEEDPAQVRSERRAALRRARERLEWLERRAEDLRRRAADEPVDPEARAELEREQARVLRRLERAEREVVRAEWALRAVEP